MSQSAGRSPGAGGGRRSRSWIWRSPVRKAAAILATILLVSACGGSGLEVTDAWGRSSPAVADAAAFYVSIGNGSDEDDRLVSATSDRCGAVELHNSMMNDEGVMTMNQADPSLLAIPAGGTLEMAPGGLHVMCLQVTEAPRLGEEIDLMLEFASGASLDVLVSIEDR